MRSLVEDHNYLMAYYGTGHASQAWQAEQVRAVTTTFVRQLTYVVVPRSGSRGVTCAVYVNSDAGGTIRVQCDDTGQVSDLVLAAGLQYGQWTLAALDAGPPLAGRPDAITRISFWAIRSVTGTYLDILALSFVDSDLTVATLPPN